MMSEKEIKHVEPVALKSLSKSKAKTWIGFFRRWTFRVAGLLILFSVGFATSAWLLGNFAVNRDFQHAGAEGVEILIVNNGVHADLVIPLDDPRFRWLDKIKPEDFPHYDPRFRYGVIGWGNREFYMQTPTWNDLKIATVLWAFLGMGETVVHVSLTEDLHWPKESARKIRLSKKQFDSLSQYLMKTFKQRADGSLVPVQGAHYHTTDAFYEATGNYHLFRTCNVWAGSALAQSGVRVGFWTLTPKLLFACLPEQAPE